MVREIELNSPSEREKYRNGGGDAAERSSMRSRRQTGAKTTPARFTLGLAGRPAVSLLKHLVTATRTAGEVASGILPPPSDVSIDVHLYLPEGEKEGPP